MNKFFIVIFIFVHSPNIFSQEKKNITTTKIQGSKEMPLELNLLLESLGDSVEADKILPFVMNIDTYARVLSKEDIFLIGKVEIYKTLLKTNERFPKATVDGNSIKILRDAIKKTQDAFVKWFLQSLLQDCESLLSSSNYKEYLLQKNNGRLEKIEFRKIDKKVQLIFRWVSKISPDSPDFQSLLKTDLVPIMIDSLINIENSFYLMASSAIFESVPTLLKSAGELKFFSLKEIKVTKKIPVKEKTVEDIIDSTLEEPKPTETILPKPSKDDWLNEDNAPLNLKNLPKPSNDADWLQDL